MPFGSSSNPTAIPAMPAPSAAVQRRKEAYDEMRRRAQQNTVQQQQVQGDALKRRFAAIGNLNSGAFIKAQNQVQQAAAEQGNQAMRDIDAQQSQEDVQREQAEQQLGIQREGLDIQRGGLDVQRGNLDLTRADLEESKKANAINALIGLGNADLDGLGTDASRINDLLKAYGISNAAVPRRQPQIGYGPFGQPYLIGA